MGLGIMEIRDEFFLLLFLQSITILNEYNC